MAKRGILERAWLDISSAFKGFGLPDPKKEEGFGKKIRDRNSYMKQIDDEMYPKKGKKK